MTPDTVQSNSPARSEAGGSRLYEWLAEPSDGLALDDADRDLYQLSNWAMLLGMTSHAMFMGVFAVLDIPVLVASNIVSVMWWGAALWLSKRGMLIIAMYVATLEVVVNAVLVTAMLGIGVGFHYYILLAIVFLAQFSIEPMRRRAIGSTSLGFGYVLLIGWASQNAMVLVVDDAVVASFGVFNALGFIGLLVGLCLWYTYRVQQDRQGRLDAERRLRRAHRHNSATLNYMADGLFTVDAQGLVASMNQSMSFMLSSRPSAAGDRSRIPQGLIDLGHTAMWEGKVKRLELALTDNRTAAAVASPLLAEDGGMAEGAVVLVRDITIDKEVDRMKTEFTSMVSHELRTPMTSVIGFAKIVKNKLEKQVFPVVTTDDAKVLKSIGQVRQNLDIVVDEAQRLTNLINDVLDIAKMEAAQVSFASKPVQADELVKRAHDACAALFERGEVTLKTEVEQGLPAVLGDRDRLQQVLVNLVSNASKFTTEGSVTIEAARLANAVVFRVRDTGPGIHIDDLVRVFDRFRQLEGGDTDKPKGTGLGLAICKQIIEGHKGKIRAESTLGVGSTFLFELPVAESVNHADLQ